MPVHVSDAWEAARIVYPQVARRKRATIWGEKTPHAYQGVLRMADKFPDTRFIFLWRDMNAVMESIARAALAERFFRKIAKRALVGNEKLREGCDARLGPRSGGARGELRRSVSNTSECMQRICEFLGVPFESQITSLDGADRSAIFSGQHHATVRGNRIVGRRVQPEALPPLHELKLAVIFAAGSSDTTVSGPNTQLNCRKALGHPALLNFGATGFGIKASWVGINRWRWSMRSCP